MVHALLLINILVLINTILKICIVQYVAAMMGLFGKATQQLCNKLDVAATSGESVEMESLFSQLTLDIIGKAVFNYDFNSLSNDTGIVEVRVFSWGSKCFAVHVWLCCELSAFGPSWPQTCVSVGRLCI